MTTLYFKIVPYLPAQMYRKGSFNMQSSDPTGPSTFDKFYKFNMFGNYTNYVHLRVNNGTVYIYRV